MNRLLKLSATAVMVCGLAAFGWSLPWSRWLGRGDLAFLPNRQTDFILNPPWVAAVAPLVPLLIYAASAALALLALAGIVGRLDSIRQRQSGHAEAAAPAASSPTGPAPIWNRLASARILRIAAAAVIAATVATAVMPYVWLGMIWRRETVLHDTYFVAIDTASIVGLLVVASVVTLMLVVLARILDRLDDIQGR